jgi:hypothetical protein
VSHTIIQCLRMPGHDRKEGDNEPRVYRMRVEWGWVGDAFFTTTTVQVEVQVDPVRQIVECCLPHQRWRGEKLRKRKDCEGRKKERNREHF